MNFENLSGALKAELARNKAKSAVLIVMCLVALYFWTPLLVKWLGGDSSEEMETAVEEPVVSANQATPASVQPAQETSVPPAQEKRIDWRSAIARLREEPLLRSIDSFALTRNPFADLSKENDLEALEEVEEDEPEEQFDEISQPVPPVFDELGLVLDGTMVGNRTRMATINGEICVEGQEIVVFATEGVEQVEPTATVIVRAIHSNHVVLGYDGHVHKLYLQPFSLSQNGSVVITRPVLNSIKD